MTTIPDMFNPRDRMVWESHTPTTVLITTGADVGTSDERVIIVALDLDGVLALSKQCAAFLRQYPDVQS